VRRPQQDNEINAVNRPGIGAIANTCLTYRIRAIASGALAGRTAEITSRHIRTIENQIFKM
jgi:hypothetical protein